MPTYPTFSANSQDLGRQAHASGIEPAGWVERQREVHAPVPPTIPRTGRAC
ncbi:hypothetical protein OV450_4606 [Actinobacteria bacterium OV450]|nr:hypothetical protein OV450_4606 [Actinobacteria bacterium OV450]